MSMKLYQLNPRKTMLQIKNQPLTSISNRLCFCAIRNNISNFLGEFVDSAVFMTIAFYGVFASGFSENISVLMGLILPYWIVKCAMSVVATPLVYTFVASLKKEEKH